MGALTIAFGIQFVEAARCDAGEQQTLDGSREHVGDIELTVVLAVGQDHVGPEHPHRQPRQVMGLT
ncbi:Uncharacterised protein [Mycobacteroides abscessus subsp. massiliense]|nr:Uncharacterised protein [Mycobacteroides abscessus subsp. massiliense]